MSKHHKQQHLELTCKYLAEILHIPSFILHGGAVLDSLLHPNCLVQDLDIVILEDKTKIQIRNSLQIHGYQVEEREYQVRFQPTHIIMAKKDGYTLLDIAFLSDTSMIGLFNIESLIFIYPDLNFIRLEDVFSALSTRILRPVRSFDEENPFCWLSRLVVLAAKYSLPLNVKEHLNYINMINQRILIWQHENFFHNTEVPASHYSSILGSIVRAENQISFIQDLVFSGAISITMPELHCFFLVCFQKNIQNLLKSTTKQHLVSSICGLMDKESKRIFLYRLSSLTLRTWSKSDQDVAAFCRNYQD
jgi:hypothetical protein